MSYAAIQEHPVNPRLIVYPDWVIPPASGMKVVPPARLKVIG